MTDEASEDFEDRLSGMLEWYSQMEPGWDSYGGLPPSPKAISRLAVFLRALDSSAPSVCATPRGTIQCEWFNGVIVEIGESDQDDSTHIPVEEEDG